VGFADKVREHVSSWKRLWRLARKPDREEYTLLLRLSFLGFALVGVLAYVVHLVASLVALAP